MGGEFPVTDEEEITNILKFYVYAVHYWKNTPISHQRLVVDKYTQIFWSMKIDECPSRINLWQSQVLQYLHSVITYGEDFMSG